MLCKICSAAIQKKFAAVVLTKYKVDYFFCERCRFLQTEEPYWLEEAYKSPISAVDTGIVARNMNLLKTVSAIITVFFNRQGHFVDYAGGCGIFVRLMRDVGFDFYWDDPYATNLFARCFEYCSAIKEIELLTAIECFEHLTNPLQDVEKMFVIAPNVLFTTELLPNLIPDPHAWWYYGLEHGQHISFYSQTTLQYLAKKYAKNFYSFGNIHLLAEKRIGQRFFEYVIQYGRRDLVFNIIKRLLKSKTVDDMHYVIKVQREKAG